MKADHLNRKTIFKKHKDAPNASMSCAESAVRFFDMTDMNGPAIDGDALTWAIDMMDHSPTARALYAQARMSGWIFETADLQGGGYYMDSADRRLLIDHFSMDTDALARSPYFRNAFLLTFARALRDIAQEEAYGSFTQRVTHKPEDLLALERVRVADGDAVAIFIAWELRGAGFGEIWRHALGSEEGDMAMMFARAIERDPKALFDGTALAYAFRQWYADQARVNDVDHVTLEALDQRLQESGQRNPFGKTELDPILVESLSDLPCGIRYLAGLGRMIMQDPFFAGLNDPINQMHLFHLVYDMEVTMINNVPFRDAKLARLIFPHAQDVKTWH